MATSPHGQRRPAARVDPAQRPGWGPLYELATRYRQWRTPCQLNRRRLTISASLGAGDPDRRQGGRHADTTRIRGFRFMRDLRNYGVCCYFGVGPRCAARSQRRRHAKDLTQTDGPMPGYVTVLVEAIIEPGVPLGRHTHPGIESAYVLEGGFEPPIQGQPTRTLKVGDAFQIPPETPHAGGKPGDAKSRIYCVPILPCRGISNS
jgi:quercetin dioxygenase-like cupin family protein